MNEQIGERPYMRGRTCFKNKWRWTHTPLLISKAKYELKNYIRETINGKVYMCQKSN